jgi:hypothetical protein
MSPPPRPGASPSPGRPADRGIELLERFDNFAGLRNALKDISAGRQDWAGIPMPLDGHRLVIEPRYPQGAGLAAIGAPPPRELDDRTRIRNSWWSDRLRGEVYIFEDDGKIQFVVDRKFHHFAFDLQTLGCSIAWGIEQEGTAVHLLGTLVRHHQFKQYMLTGMFLEKSKRSGLTYMFRRLKPTVVIDARDESDGHSARILTTLCLHPIGYYSGSWAGAMCPTDDVVAHLMLMRGDEHMFWKRSNQHHPIRPEAGL